MPRIDFYKTTIFRYIFKVGMYMCLLKSAITKKN